MCDAKYVINRLKDLINDCEQDQDRRPRSPGQQSIASSSASTPSHDLCPTQGSPPPRHPNTKLYTTPVSSQLPPVCPDADGPIPGCHSYEIRCKQTLDGNVATPGILCTAGQNDTLYPPTYFGNKTGDYRSVPGKTIKLDFDIDTLSCACKNGFCPPSRYDQFMAGKGGLPAGHPDATRPDKFHHPFGMGTNYPAARDHRNRGN